MVTNAKFFMKTTRLTITVFSNVVSWKMVSTELTLSYSNLTISNYKTTELFKTLQKHSPYRTSICSDLQRLFMQLMKT